MATFDVIKNNLGSMFTYITLGVSITAWILILLVVCAIIIGITIFILNRRSYKFTIIIFEDVNGSYVDTGKDNAMEFKFGHLGKRILYWRKRKIYTIFPEDRVQQNRFYFIRNKITGEYIPITINASENEKQLLIQDKLRSKMLGYNVGIRKAIEKEFEVKQSWIRENAVVLISVTFIIILGVIGWLIMDKMLAISGSLSDLAKTLADLTEKVNKLLGVSDSLCSGGSGIRPA